VFHISFTDCEVRSTLSSPGTSYLDLIRDYAANKRTEQASGELPEDGAASQPSDSALFQIVSDTLSHQESSSKEKENLPTLTASSDNLYRDVLTLVNSDFKLNIEDSVDIETKVRWNVGVSVVTLFEFGKLKFSVLY
jgi:hypothetical protein